MIFDLRRISHCDQIERKQKVNSKSKVSQQQERFNTFLYPFQFPINLELNVHIKSAIASSRLLIFNVSMSIGIHDPK